jgi:hypothetical protein
MPRDVQFDEYGTGGPGFPCRRNHTTVGAPSFAFCAKGGYHEGLQ